jgi:hypothetical protein
MRHHLVTILLGAALTIMVIIVLHDRATIERLAAKAARWDDQCEFVENALETDALALRSVDTYRTRLRAQILADLWTDSSPPYQSSQLTMACGVPPVLLDIADSCPARDPICLANVAELAARAVHEWR